MARIYISSGVSDGDRAEQLAERLRNAGYSVIMDRARGTAEQIDQADVVLVLISPDAAESIRVVDEINRAINRRKPLIPFIVKETPLPPELSRFQFIDATRDWDAAVRQLELALPTLAPVGGGHVPSVQPPSPVIARTQETPAPAPPQYYTPPAAPQSRTRFLMLGIVVVVVLILALLVVSLLGRQGISVSQYQTASSIAATNNGVQSVVPITFTAKPWTLTPSYTPVPSDTATPTASGTESIFVTVGSAPLSVDLQTIVAQDVEATVAAQTPVVLVATVAPSVTLSVDERVQETMVAIRSTDSNSLSPKEAAQLIAQAIQQTQGNNGSANNNLLTNLLIFALGLVVAGAGIGAITGLVRRSTFTEDPVSRQIPAAQPVQAIQSAHPQYTPHPMKQEPLLQEFEVFISSSDRDRSWVAGLVKDLEAQGHLVWWYAKDAPGLPFGQEIKSAIFYTKVFLVVLSPDSMKSKHIEEEIRWAEQFSRPIIPVLARSVPVEDRLYGLGKAADIDFTDTQRYNESMDLLTQAIRHYLRKRLQDAQGAAGPEESN